MTTPDFDKIARELSWCAPAGGMSKNDRDYLAADIRAALEDAYNAGLEEAADIAGRKRKWANDYLWPEVIAREVRSRKIVKP